MNILSFPLILSTILLSGCANLNSIHRSTENWETKKAGDSTVSFIDAKQRAVWQTTKYKGTEAVTIVCAEPSPDALSAISSNLGFNLEKDDIKAAFNAVVAEGASTIGIRTSSIQLLRDALYRACEAYASGALTPDAYNRLSKRYQKSMVTLLAIEQLTSSVYPPSMTLSSTANNQYNKHIYDATKASIATKDNIQQLETSLDKANITKTATASKLVSAKEAKEAAEKAAEGKTCKGDNTKTVAECVTLSEATANFKSANSELIKITKEIETLTAQEKRAQEDLAQWNKALDQLKEPSRDASVTATTTPNTRTVTQADLNKIADTVRGMVQDTQNADIIEVCLDTDLTNTLIDHVKNNSFSELAAGKNHQQSKAAYDAIIARFSAQTLWCTNHLTYKPSGSAAN